MELIFLGSQPSLSTKSLKCVHGLCRDGICTDTSELEADLHLLKTIPKGLQVHRCTHLSECFWDSISIHIYYKYKHMLPKLCMNKCKIYRRLAENFQALDGRRKTTLPNSRNSAAAVASLSDLHLYCFNRKFHQFAPWLPKLTFLKALHELRRVCCCSSKITVTSQSDSFILKYYLWITLYSISFPHRRLFAMYTWHCLFPILQY